MVPPSPAQAAADRPATGRSRWRAAGRALVMLICGAFLGLGVPWLAPTLNGLRIAGFPFGYYVVAQGAPIFMSILLFIYVGRTNASETSERNTVPQRPDQAGKGEDSA